MVVAPTSSAAIVAYLNSAYPISSQGADPYASTPPASWRERSACLSGMTNKLRRVSNMAKHISDLEREAWLEVARRGDALLRVRNLARSALKGPKGTHEDTLSAILAIVVDATTEPAPKSHPASAHGS
jgi:hypothetical protein